jgi:opacity protein-like surface antigen
MKKIFTIILAAAGTIGAASAQSNHEKSVAYNNHSKNSYGYDDHAGYGKSNTAGYHDGYNSYKEKQKQPERINRGYDQKIVFVKNDYHLRGRGKGRNGISKSEFRYAKNFHDGNKRTAGHDEHKW